MKACIYNSVHEEIVFSWVKFLAIEGEKILTGNMFEEMFFA